MYFIVFYCLLLYFIVFYCISIIFLLYFIVLYGILAAAAAAATPLTNRHAPEASVAVAQDQRSLARASL